MSNKQVSGDDSESYQAGRDLTIYNSQGLTADAFVILDRMVEKEVQRYTIDALAEARSRYDEIFRELVARIDQFDADRLRRLADPGVQADVLEAGDAYARSGRGDVKESLIDLITLRCDVDAGSLQGTVLSEAIATTRRITRGGIAILAIVFLATRVRSRNLESLEDFEAWAVTNIAPFLPDLPEGEQEYEYLRSTVAASDGMIVTNLVEYLMLTYPGLFQRGIKVEEVPENLVDKSELFCSGIHDPALTQIAALNDDVLEVRIRDAGLGESEASRYRDIFKTNKLGENEVREVIATQCPTWLRLLGQWDNNPSLGRTRVTSIGVAIAHCTWTSRTAEPSSLSTWIP